MYFEKGGKPVKAMPQGGIFGKAGRMIQTLADMRITLYASHACYFIVLAVFPSLVLLLSLLRYIGLDINDFTQALDGVIPSALLPMVKKIIFNTYTIAHHF